MRSLARKLRGELDWITLRCLEKDPARRYASASELSADIVGYLHQEPISAGPPRLSYRLGKLVRKHRAAVAGVVATVVALVIGLVISLVLYQRANELLTLSLSRSYVANVAAADLAIQLGSASEARRRLAQAPPSLRSWEWHHLSLIADSSVSAFETGPGMIQDVNFNPSSRQIIWSDGDRVGEIDLASNQQRVRRPSGFLRGRSRDGRRGLVLTSAAMSERRMPVDDEWTLQFRDLDSDKVIATIGSHSPSHVLFSPNGARVLVAFERAREGDTRRLLLLDGRTGERVTDLEWPLELDESPIWSSRVMAFSPDGERIALCAGSSLYLWDTSTSRALVRKAPLHPGEFGWLSFTDDGSKIVCIDRSGGYLEWEAATGRALTSRLLPRRGAPSAMTRDGSQGAWVEGERVVVADVMTGTVLMTLLGHSTPVLAVTYSADGSLLVSAAFDGIRVWLAGVDRARTRLQASTVASLAFHPTRPILLAADGTHGLDTGI